MDYQVIESSGKKYIYLDAGGKQIQNEQCALDLISICAEHDTDLLLIQGDRLSDDFLRLGTGVAGAVLQKFAQYNIKVSVVLDGERVKGKFKELLQESNRGKIFRAYASLQSAENWLLGKIEKKISTPR
jgi:hypothetical protein